MSVKVIFVFIINFINLRGVLKMAPRFFLKKLLYGDIMYMCFVI